MIKAENLRGAKKGKRKQLETKELMGGSYQAALNLTKTDWNRTRKLCLV